jgi:hypothetical protein
MPLGDSITKGARDGDGGYRSRLYADLIDAGQPTTFVGAATTCASTILNGAGQGNHNGYGSYKISDLYQNLAGTTSSANPEGGDNNDGGYWMTGGGGTGRSAVYPSVVTLMAGTNDADSGESAATMETYMSQLLNWFAANRPSTLMMVGSVIPSSSSSPEANIETFNTWLQTVEIPSLDKNNPKEFVFVDLHSPFIDSNGNLKTSTSPDGIYLYDGIHPSHAGYTAMGDAFDNAIVADMPEPGALPAFCMVCAAVLLKRRRMPVGLGLRENGVSVRVHERRSAEKAICAI